MANSSAEAEYVAMCPVSQNIVWIRQLLSQLDCLKVRARYTSTLWCDNQSAIAMSINPVHHQRTKHIAIKYHYIRDLISNGVIVTDYVRSEENVADICTKSLAETKVNLLKRKLFGFEDIAVSAKRVRTIVSDEYI